MKHPKWVLTEPWLLVRDSVSTMMVGDLNLLHPNLALPVCMHMPSEKRGTRVLTRIGIAWKTTEMNVVDTHTHHNNNNALMAKTGWNCGN